MRFPANHLRAGLAAAALLMAACGYVGDPLPPALHIPVPATDLAVVERGERLIVQFAASGMTTEGMAAENYSAIDLRIGAEGVQPFDRATWEARAEPIEVTPPEQAGLVRVETPAARWAGREVIVGVRLGGSRGRWSEWSNLVAVTVVEPLPAPVNVEAESVASGVGLRWRAGERAGLRYRVFRRLAGGETSAEAGETDEAAWVDSEAVFGASYEYRVQALVAAGERPAESELSEPVTITPEDRFPPPPPENLRATPGLDTIELTWDRVDAGDLASYRVYRAAGDENGGRIAERVTAPGYSDRAIVPGVRYSYRVTAVDLLNNESEPSAAVELAAPPASRPGAN